MHLHMIKLPDFSKATHCVHVEALNATIKNGFDAVVAAIEAHTASKQDES